MLNFFGFLFSFLKRIYYTCAIQTQFKKQACVARILFAGLFGFLSTSIRKSILDAQTNEYNKKLLTTPNAYHTPQVNRNTTSTAPQLHNLHNNHPLSLVPRSYRNTAITEHISSGHSYSQSPVTQIVAHQPNIEDTYEQIVEQHRTTNLRSQNNPR